MSDQDTPPTGGADGKTLLALDRLANGAADKAGRGHAAVAVKGDSDGPVAELAVRRVGGHQPDMAETLAGHGYDPDQWIVVRVSHSEWTMPNGKPGTATRYALERKPQHVLPPPPADMAAAAANAAPPKLTGDQGRGFLVALGDMQVGKVDGDGPQGTINRTKAALDDAKRRYVEQGGGHVHIAFLGDHIEGFESQGGGNGWRTPLGLTQQVAAVRDIMMYAMLLFAPVAPRLSLAAVPGNHGRVSAGRGMKSFANDNWDTECLAQVADVAKVNPDGYRHVSFHMPGLDEETIAVDVAGVRIGHVHGHQWRRGGHFSWWQGQAFGGNLADATVLLAGHYHHLQVETWGGNMFLQVPALEGESTWWRHRTGTPGHPGLVTARIGDGRLREMELHHGD